MFAVADSLIAKSLQERAASKAVRVINWQKQRNDRRGQYERD
jgi:hypothetical protein